MTRIILFALVLLVAAGLIIDTGFKREIVVPGASIASINRDPHHYYSRQVAVSGTVMTATGMLGSGIYRLRDVNGAELLVLSSHDLPPAGTTVAIRGTLRQAAIIGDRQVKVFVEDGGYNDLAR
jgi:hypothetical protein